MNDEKKEERVSKNKTNNLANRAWRANQLCRSGFDTATSPTLPQPNKLSKTQNPRFDRRLIDRKHNFQTNTIEKTPVDEFSKHI